MIGQARKPIAWILLLLVVGMQQAASQTGVHRAAKPYHDLLGSFPVAQSGYGQADYPSKAPQHIPKAYAMVLLAESNRARVTGTKLSWHGREAARWLLDNSDLNRNGVIGWGVPIAWDAYGDGTTNPANTEYTISTAIVIHALLDWLISDRNAPRDKVMRQVSAAVDPYLSADMRSTSGLFPYSLNKNDRRYDTFNPAAYLAGQIQRWSTLIDDPQKKKLGEAAADATMQVLINHRQVDPQGGWFWHYSVQETVPNDVAHAAYVADGVRTYVAYGGRLASMLDADKAMRHLVMFLNADKNNVRGWPTFRKDAHDPARLYDLGMGLAMAASSRPMLNDLESAVLSSLERYRRADGRYAKYPIGWPASGVSLAGNAVVIREYEAYLLHGLSQHFFRVPPDKI